MKGRGATEGGEAARKARLWPGGRAASLGLARRLAGVVAQEEARHRLRRGGAGFGVAHCAIRRGCRAAFSGSGRATSASSTASTGSPLASSFLARAISALRHSSVWAWICWISGTTPLLRIALVHPVHEAQDARVDDGFGLGHRGLPVVFAGLHHAGQIVHRVEVDVVQGL